MKELRIRCSRPVDALTRTAAHGNSLYRQTGADTVTIARSICAATLLVVISGLLSPPFSLRKTPNIRRPGYGG